MKHKVFLFAVGLVMALVFQLNAQNFVSPATAPSSGRLFTNNERTFIVDGPQCANYDGTIIDNRVSGFHNVAVIQSPEDILSVCINMEHSYMGDLRIELLCPSYNSQDSTGHGLAVLKYRDTNGVGYPLPGGTWGGGSRFMGVPYGGANDGGYDRMNNGDMCDSTDNPFGFGFDYCFSRNRTRTLVNGDPANTSFPANAGLANAQSEPFTYTFPPIPASFTGEGQTCGTVAVSTMPASNREEGIGFYVPASDFTSLIGCPINGVWQLKITDTWGIDNGWVFNWSIAFGTDTTTANYEIRTCTGQTLLFEVENGNHTARVIGYVGQCMGSLTVPAWFSVDGER